MKIKKERKREEGGRGQRMPLSLTCKLIILIHINLYVQLSSIKLLFLVSFISVALSLHCATFTPLINHTIWPILSYCFQTLLTLDI